MMCLHTPQERDALLQQRSISAAQRRRERLELFRLIGAVLPPRAVA